MSYTDFDGSKPVTSPDTRQATIDVIRTNLLALRDGVLIGRVSGWTATSVTGTGSMENPQYRVWAKGTERLRGTYGYTSGFVTSIVWEYSGDSGSTPNGTGTWSEICTETVTFDEGWNFTGGSNSSWLSWLYELFGKFKLHRDGSGSAVHGLGNMSTQAKSAVDITGGTINGVTLIGGSVAPVYEREAVVAKGNVSGSVALNWSEGGLVTATITAAGGSFTHSNLPSGVVGYLTVDLTNGGVATSGTTLFPNVKWPSASVPVFSVAGRDIVTLMCHDGAVVNGVHLRGMG